jgi:hypothetical protein
VGQPDEGSGLKRMADASTDRLEWQGRKLASRVWVRTTGGKFLFHTTPRAAIELLQLGAVEPTIEGKKVWCLDLLSTPGPIKKPLRLTGTIRDVCSAPTIRLAKQGNLKDWNGAKTYEFTKLNDNDKWAYILAITTNQKV